MPKVLAYKYYGNQKKHPGTNKKKEKKQKKEKKYYKTCKVILGLDTP